MLVLAENASPDLETELDAKGISFEKCAIYRTVPVTSASKSPKSSDAGYVVFSSQASVRAFFGSGVMPGGAKAVCMGSAAAKELMQYFNGTILMAEKAGIPGVVSTIISDQCQRR